MRDRCIHLIRSATAVLTTTVCFMIAVTSIHAGEPRSFEQPLWADGAPGALGSEPKDVPMAMVRLPQSKEPIGALVICPGGGYGGLAMDHEGHQFVKWANDLGLAAIICDYRHRGKGYGHPAPLQDAQRAIRLVRHNAKDWNIDPKNVGIIGFSAGGHLVSTVLTHFDAGDANASDPIARQSSRPDYGILCYPVIALGTKYAHKGSERNLLGDNPDPSLLKSLQNDTQVTKDTPPTFLFHTLEDTVVPVENALLFYQAMVANKVAGELHVFQFGRHGVGLGAGIPGTSTWSDACIHWMRSNHFVK